MAKYRVKWAELSYYKMEVEAENKKEAWDKALNESDSRHIVMGYCQFKECVEIIEPAEHITDVIYDPSAGQGEVSLRKEADNG